MAQKFKFFTVFPDYLELLTKSEGYVQTQTQSDKNMQSRILKIKS